MDPGETVDLHQFRVAVERVLAELSKRVVGQRRVLELLRTALFAHGHGLFIGVPGLAKTLIISTMAQTLRLAFNRIQFTPDLMPADITGTDILEHDAATGQRVFRFVKGPVFTNLLLADEINRTPPKTQAALLQAMQEYEVTASGTTYQLAQPFVVFATQNPIEQEGTYPLPEAQLDRFMLSVHVTYPSENEEIAIIQRTTVPELPPVAAVLTADEIRAYQGLAARVPVSDSVVRYAVAIVRRTRPTEDTAPSDVRRYLSWGAGPRATQHLIQAARAWALLHGEPAVSADDIRALAGPVLQHRLVTNFHAEAEGVSAADVLAQAVAAAPF